jgi:hypothetical protein
MAIMYRVQSGTGAAVGAGTATRTVSRAGRRPLWMVLADCHQVGRADIDQLAGPS